MPWRGDILVPPTMGIIERRMTSARFGTCEFLQFSSEEVAGPKPSLEGYGGVQPRREEGFVPAAPCAALFLVEHLFC